jgi:hypothetical protein
MSTSAEAFMASLPPKQRALAMTLGGPVLMGVDIDTTTPVSQDMMFAAFTSLVNGWNHKYPGKNFILERRVPSLGILSIEAKELIVPLDG